MKLLAGSLPVKLDVDNPTFHNCLEECVKTNAKLRAIVASNQPQVVRVLRKLPLFVLNGVNFLRLYLLKPLPMTQLEGTVR